MKPTQGFLFGLLGFIAVAVLIEQYDNQHGSGWLWVYTLIVGLGLTVKHPAALASGLSGIQASLTGQVSGAGSNETNGKTQPGGTLSGAGSNETTGKNG